MFLFIERITTAKTEVSMISIQHLFLFIQYKGAKAKAENDFNTTLVFIYQDNGIMDEWGTLVFQYNTCFYLSRILDSVAICNAISIQHLFLFIHFQENPD